MRRTVHIRRIVALPDILGVSPRSDSSGRECQYRIRVHNTGPEAPSLSRPVGLSQGELRLLQQQL